MQVMSLETERIAASLPAAESRQPFRQGSVETIYATYSVGLREELYLGQIAKILHLLSPEQRAFEAARVRNAQQKFWAKNFAFRNAIAGEGEANAEDIIYAMGLVGSFARFANIRPGDLVVDHCAGSIPFLDYLTRQQAKTIKGYVAYDGNPLVEPFAKRRIERRVMQEKVEFITLQDFAQGWPQEQISQRVAELNPTRVVHVTCWGATYLALDDMMRLFKEALSPKVSQGLPTEFNINMLTDGQFDPDIIADYFRKHSVPANLIRGRFKTLSRSKFVQKRMQQFGWDLAKVAPIWTAGELIPKFGEHGLKIVEPLKLSMAGQTISMRIRQ